MPIPTIIGTGGSGNLPTTNELPVDMSKKKYSAIPYVIPLTAISSRLSKDPAHNFRVDLQEEHAMPITVEVAVDVAADGTTLVVPNYGMSLVKGTVLTNPRSMDAATVDSTPTTNTVTITKSACGTTGAIWYAGDPLIVTLPAVSEIDEDLTRGASVQDTNVYNYTQLCKLQFNISRTANAMSSHFGGPGSKRAQLKRQKFEEYLKKSEMMRIVGARSTSGTAPATTRTMGGLTSVLYDGTLFKDFSAGFTESGFDNWLGSYADLNPDKRRVSFIGAPNVLRQINYWLKDKIRISPNAQRFGMNIMQYFNGPLDIDLIRHPLLVDKVTSGWGFIIDWESIMLKEVQPLTYFPDAKSVGESEVIYDIYRELTSMLIANESCHAMMVGAV